MQNSAPFVHGFALVWGFSSQQDGRYSSNDPFQTGELQTGISYVRPTSMPFVSISLEIAQETTRLTEVLVCSSVCDSNYSRE
jgi:hypothetical protein